MQLPTCCATRLQLVAGSGLAGATAWNRHGAAAEWAAWYGHPSNKCGRWGDRRRPTKHTDMVPVTTEHAKGYAATPAGYIGRMRVSVLSVLNSIGPLHPCEVAWLAAQQGSAEYCVSAAMLWARAMSEAGHHSIACRLMRINMAAGVESGLLELEQIARRSCRLDGGAIGSHVLVARLKTLLGRDLTTHDVAAELQGRCTIKNVPCYGLPNPWPGASWRQQFSAVLAQKLAMAMLPAVAARDQNPEKWAATRAVWLPTGTTSIKHASAGDPAHELMDAAAAVGWPLSKKARWANLRLKLDDLLGRRPQMVSRCATKNEPGLKKRPLRAADDHAYLIASYASAGIEKTYTQGGAVMRQRPTDVQETVRALSCTRGQYALCIDYSDFNLTHLVSCRAELSAQLARVYRSKGQNKSAQAADWIAQAHYNHTVDGHRVLRGLSSGERDTARDNTILHTVYAQLAINALGPVGQDFERSFFRCCGDDEIVIGLSWPTAISYVLELEAQGHVLQTRKIMLSQDCGEFLQYNMFSDGRMPQQPLCPALINAVSGSWYKTAAYNTDEVPNQAASTFGGLARRGVPLEVAQRLAISCCNWLCTGVAWRRALAATDLFGRTASKAATSSPITGKDVQAAIGGPSLGAREYVSWLARTKNLSCGQTQSIAAPLMQLIDGDVYGAALSAVQRRQGHTPLRQEGDDIDRVPTPKPEPVDITALMSSWKLADLGPRVDWLESLAMVSGMPLAIIKVLGIKTAVAMLSNSELMQLNQFQTARLHIPTGNRHLLPGAIESQFV